MYNSACSLFSSDSGPAELLPVVEVADVDEGVEEFHYVNAALSVFASLNEGRKAGRPPFNSFPTDRGEFG